MAARTYRVTFFRQYSKTYDGFPNRWSSSWVETIEANHDEDVRIKALAVCERVCTEARWLTDSVVIHAITEIVQPEITRTVELTEKERRGSRAA